MRSGGYVYQSSLSYRHLQFILKSWAKFGFILKGHTNLGSSTCLAEQISHQNILLWLPSRAGEQKLVAPGWWWISSVIVVSQVVQHNMSLAFWILAFLFDIESTSYRCIWKYQQDHFSMSTILHILAKANAAKRCLSLLVLLFNPQVRLFYHGSLFWVF